MRVAGGFGDEIGVVKGEVATDADVADADQVDGVLPMPGDSLRGFSVISDNSCRKTSYGPARLGPTG
jgi:hypothetical protein